MLQLYTNIRSRREALGLSQSELASKVGYSGKSMISKIERGEVNLGLTAIKKFATALECTASELFGSDGVEWDPTTQEVNEKYYINDEAQEMAEFLLNNPNYKVLFDASRKVKPEDITKAVTALGLFSEEE